MSKSILIVEDDRALARMWTELLTAEGFDVVAEKDGEWALKAFDKRSFDAVILDVLVPVKNGFQLAERIRKMPGGADVGILLVSGIYRSAHHRPEAIAKYRVLDYLDKPVKNEALLARLRRFFGDAYPNRAAADKERARVDRAPADQFATQESRREVEEVEEVSRSGIFRGLGVGRGELRTKPFPELLAELYRWKATGALLLKRGRVKKIVYFKDGYPIFVKSNLLGECLGKLMVRERMITEDQAEESLQLMRSSGRMQGTVLIEMGLISPHNLVFALELQLRTKLLEIFKWEEGRYQFTSRTDLPANTVSLDSTPATLIHEGIREFWSLSRVMAAMGDADDTFVVAADDPLYRFQELDLSPSAEKLVSRINGRRTLGELVEGGQLDREEAYKLLFALRCAQVVRLDSKRGRRSDKVAPPPPKLPRRPPPIPTKPKGGALLPEVAELAAGGPSGEDERELKATLTKRLKEMRKQNFFEILGVARTASSSEIRKAYFALARECHPDKIARSMGDEVRHLAGEVYELVTRAHDVLADDGEREAYLKQIASGTKKKEGPDEVSKILAAEGKFQRGEGYLRKERFHDAFKAFREAVDLYPEEGEFHAYLGWSLFQTAPGDSTVTEEAMDHIMRAIQLNPKVDKAYLFLGYIYKASGRADKAEKQFEKAIQANPDCTEALRELRLYSGRRA